MQASKHQQTISNRTALHSGVRGATEQLQQEVGQAGGITLPTASVTMQTAVTVPSGTTPCVQVDGGWSGGVTATVTLSSIAGMWAASTTGIKLTTLDGDSSETIIVQTLTAASKQIAACFSRSHAANAKLMALGGFPEGIPAPSPAYGAPWSATAGTYTNGSDANRLKLFGDINGDGNVGGPSRTLRQRRRRRVAFTQPVSQRDGIRRGEQARGHRLAGSARQRLSQPARRDHAASVLQISMGDHRGPAGHVLDVAITLTVRTQQIDPVTKTYQTETKALLDVLPRKCLPHLDDGRAGRNRPPPVHAADGHCAAAMIARPRACRRSGGAGHGANRNLRCS